MSLATPSRWHRATSKMLDLLLPPLCLSCEAPVGGSQTLCPACWGKIHFITNPFCACCGAPFDTQAGEGMLCGRCMAEPPHFETARAAMLYNDASRHLILGFKHSDRIHPAKALAGWMQRAGSESWDSIDYIMPVPLHRWRLLKRRYNQAALLASALSAKTGKPALMNVLQRTRATPTQGHRGRKERQENVHGAFALQPKNLPKLNNKIVLLIDDVLTTGATVNECSRILKKAGVREVHILTLARVPAFV